MQRRPSPRKSIELRGGEEAKRRAEEEAEDLRRLLEQVREIYLLQRSNQRILRKKMIMTLTLKCLFQEKLDAEQRRLEEEARVKEEIDRKKREEEERKKEEQERKKAAKKEAEDAKAAAAAAKKEEEARKKV